MKKKYVGFVVGAMAGAMLLGGCANEKATEKTTETVTDSETESNDYGLVEDGKLTFVVDDTVVPCVYRDENGNLEGFEYDCGNAIAERLGLEPVWLSNSWENLITTLQSGKADAICDGMYVTDKRKEVVDFCDSYYNMDMVIVVDENEEDINSSQDLINKIVGSQPACPEAEYLKTIDVTEAVEYSKIPDGILDLKNGRIDAFLTESLSGGYYAKNTECKVIFDEELPSFDVGIATNKECPELTEAINTAIKELKDDGTLSEISEKWFGMDIISEN